MPVARFRSNIQSVTISDPTDLRFLRSYRLLNARDFDGVFAKAGKSSDRFFTVLYRSSSQSTARLGFAVAKKRIPLASSRNRIKRLVRESFRHHRAVLPQVDIVIMANRAANQADNAALTDSIAGHWKSISKSASANN